MTKEWQTGHEPGRCTWPAFCCAPGAPERLTTHVVEWPEGRVENVRWFRTYACADDAQRIVEYQNSDETTLRNCGPVTMREVGEGNW